MKQLIGYCGVDSGQLMIADPCYVFPYDSGITLEQALKAYEDICEVTLSDEGYGSIDTTCVKDAGVAFVTGWGDGNYPVFAEIEHGRIFRVTIEMG